jgi:hypothetical protein
MVPEHAILKLEVELISFRDKDKEKWELELGVKLSKA